MVRSRSPLPFLYRSKPASPSRGRIKRVCKPTKSLLLSPSLYTERFMGKRKGIAQQLEQPTWKQFVEKYERFTDVLCDAAKNGCPNKLDREYIDLRHWFLEHYIVFGGRLKPYLTNCECTLTLSSGNGKHCGKPLQVLHRSTGIRRKMDYFEMVFRPATLNGLLRQDDGQLIQRVSAISDAVYHCLAEHSPAED